MAIQDIEMGQVSIDAKRGTALLTAAESNEVSAVKVESSDTGTGATALSFNSEMMPCRICMDVHPLEDRIAPCRCKGSMKWVHRGCLDLWRASPANPRAFTHCQSCNFEYRLKAVRETISEEDVKKRRRKFLRKVGSKFLLGNLFLQAFLIVLAELICMADSDAKVVTWLKGIDHKDCLPSTTEVLCRFHFFQHRTVYYMAAIFILLFCIGLYGVLYAILKACDCQCTVGPFDTCLFCWYWDIGGRVHGDGGYGCCCGCPQAFCTDFEASCETCTGAPASCGCDNCGQDDECANGVFALCLLPAIVVVLVFSGFMFMACAAVTSVYKTFQAYIQILELRELTKEYVIEDLRDEDLSDDTMQVALRASSFSSASMHIPPEKLTADLQTDEPERQDARVTESSDQSDSADCDSVAIEVELQAALAEIDHLQKRELQCVSIKDYLGANAIKLKISDLKDKVQALRQRIAPGAVEEEHLVASPEPQCMESEATENLPSAPEGCRRAASLNHGNGEGEMRAQLNKEIDEIFGFRRTPQRYRGGVQALVRQFGQVPSGPMRPSRPLR